jgi:hypothetical protein
LVARSLLFQGVVSKHEKLPSLKGIDSLWLSLCVWIAKFFFFFVAL